MLVTALAYAFLSLTVNGMFTLSMAPLVLQIFQLKARRPCNADATQISFLNAASSMVQ